MFEAMLKAVGGFGLYQWLLLLFNQLSLITVQSNWIFVALASYVAPNCTQLTSKNETDCQSAYFYSIVDEWHLVTPELKQIPSYILIAQMCGTFIGALCGGQLSDTFGRKHTLLGFSVLLHLIGLSTAFAPNWETFLAFRLVLGFSFGIVTVTQQVLFIEMLPPKWRQAGHFVGYPMVFVFTGGAGYLVKDWRSLCIIINALWVLPGLILAIGICESPKWLIEKGRLDEAKAAFCFIAKLNGKRAQSQETLDNMWHSFTAEVKAKQEDAAMVMANYSYHSLFCSGKRLALHSCVLFLTTVSVSCISWGIIFNIGSLSGDPTLNLVYIGLLEWPISFAVALLDRQFSWFGRRCATYGGMMGVFTCVLAMFVLEMFYNSTETDELLHSIGAFGAAACSIFVWFGLDLYRHELFPTALRGLGNAFCSAGSRLGNVLSAQLILLEQVWRPGPSLSMLVLSVATSVAVFLCLPETKGIPLPDIATMSTPQPPIGKMEEVGLENGNVSNPQRDVEATKMDLKTEASEEFEMKEASEVGTSSVQDEETQTDGEDEPESETIA